MELEKKTKEELKQEIDRLTAMKNELKNEEQAVKLTMNSIYGSIGNSYFVCQNPDVAEAVTLQGQELIKFAEKIINKYFNEHWHLDKELHNKLGLTNVRRVAKPLVIYIDTDSAAGETLVNVSLDNDSFVKISFHDLFSKLSETHYVEKDFKGNEIILPELWVTNYNHNNFSSKVKKLIRHRVTKDKWELKTVSGKSIIVTGDHSLMVKREGKLISIKPSEINIETDLVITTNED